MPSIILTGYPGESDKRTLSSVFRLPALWCVTFKLIILVYSRRTFQTSEMTYPDLTSRMTSVMDLQWLRTFLLQQCYPFLAQLVLPRLLAPDFPWTCYSRYNLQISHFNQLRFLAVVNTDSHLIRHCLFEKFSLLLPTLAVNAVSHAFSPESNPNSPLSVNATVDQYTTVHSW